MTDNDRTDNWRILFEGFSCSGSDRSSQSTSTEKPVTEAVFNVKETHTGKKNIGIENRKNHLEPFTRLRFAPVYNSANMQSSGKHVNKLVKKDPNSIHFARHNNIFKYKHKGKQSIIVGSRIRNLDTGFLELPVGGADVKTAGKGLIIIVCSLPFSHK